MVENTDAQRRYRRQPLSVPMPTRDGLEKEPSMDRHPPPTRQGSLSLFHASRSWTTSTTACPLPPIRTCLFTSKRRQSTTRSVPEATKRYRCPLHSFAFSLILDRHPFAGRRATISPLTKCRTYAVLHSSWLRSLPHPHLPAPLQQQWQESPMA
jgi:hypothetical protein